MKQWSFFPSNELKPSGWLHRQLEIQAKGLSGNPDKIWPDIRVPFSAAEDKELCHYSSIKLRMTVMPETE